MPAYLHQNCRNHFYPNSFHFSECSLPLRLRSDARNRFTITSVQNHSARGLADEILDWTESALLRHTPNPLPFARPECSSEFPKLAISAAGFLIITLSRV